MSDANFDTPLSPEATRILAGAIREDLGLDAEDLRLGLTVARNQLLRGAKQEALRTYVALVLCEPMNGDFQAGLANCAAQLGEHHLTLQAASALIALQPRDPRGYYLSGRACLALGHRAEAKEDLTDALSFARAAKEGEIAQEAEKLLKQLAASGE
jgi:Flp pilus assembly protein TadD